MKYFTVREARALLPRVRDWMEEIRRHRSAIVNFKPEAWPSIERSSFNGGFSGQGQLQTHANEIRRVLRQILDLGIQVKSIDDGLIDFPCLYQGRVILLCWKYGEKELAYWHEYDAGFAGRQLIDESME